MRVTLADIAKMAGVSTAAVSQVLNRHPPRPHAPPGDARKDSAGGPGVRLLPERGRRRDPHRRAQNHRSAAGIQPQRGPGRRGE
ncbi:MAG: LacI family DNA-binding transcriptional regulator [Lentisphaeria bacterium]|nr:MAG: LacI family DNA-binding transcriptional regulator [Lentisphaeria bacterium]